jgi:hypothetical protein
MDKSALIAILGQFGEAEAIAEVIHDCLPLRDPLPFKRRTERKTVTVSLGTDGNMAVDVEVGFYEDGSPGEVFLKSGKEGTAIRDLFDGIAIMLSVSMQHGVPISAFPVRGRGNELTGEGNELLDSIFEAVEELCTTPKPTTSQTASVSSCSSTEHPSASDPPSQR